MLDRGQSPRSVVTEFEQKVVILLEADAVADADERHADADADAASVDRRFDVGRQRRRRLVQDGDVRPLVEESREAKSLRLARRQVRVPAEVRNCVKISAAAVEQVAKI